LPPKKSEYELLQEWEDYMLAQGRSGTTIDKYRFWLHKLPSQTKPAKPLQDISEQDIVVFLARLPVNAHAARQLSMAAFKSFFTWAHERHHTGSNPAALLHPKAATERPADAFTPEEVGALMASARKLAPQMGERDALAIQLAYSMGLRRSEVCKLTGEDIDWSNRRVLIRESKGGKSRWVEANDLALDALTRLRPYWNGTVTGSLHPNYFTMLVNRAAKEAGFPPGRRNSHMLRAAFATGLLRAGTPIQVAQQLLGHSKISTTGRYLACFPEDRREAVARLPAPGVK